MKLNIKFSDAQKSILIMLNDSYYPKSLDYSSIERSIEALEKIKNGDTVELILNLIAGRRKYDIDDMRYREGWEPRIRQVEKDLDYLEKLSLVKRKRKDGAYIIQSFSNPESIYDYEFSPTEQGERISKTLIEGRIINYRPEKKSQTSVFVASAFGHKEIDNLYQYSILPICNKYKLEPIRVDLREPTRTITDEILEGISEAKFVIADLTYARPSVYFEVGFAHGLGIPIILTCNKNHFKGKRDDSKIHFDLQQYKISFWTKTEPKTFSWEGKLLNNRIKNILENKLIY